PARRWCSDGGGAGPVALAVCHPARHRCGAHSGAIHHRDKRGCGHAFWVKECYWQQAAGGQRTVTGHAVGLPSVQGRPPADAGQGCCSTILLPKQHAPCLSAQPAAVCCRVFATQLSNNWQPVICCGWGSTKCRMSRSASLLVVWLVLYGHLQGPTPGCPASGAPKAPASVYYATIRGIVCFDHRSKMVFK
ncbi:unnamed protein product, partial [Heterosigma akashiwo]